MLPDFFFDWWFAPWVYAADDPAQLPLAADSLGQRDGYRLWCEQAGVVADLPPGLDPGWHIVAGDTGPELMAAARLFAGLIAAREHNQAVLGELAFVDRKWCVSIAATQPLRGYGDAPFTADDPIEVRGLFELARRLQQRFPGMWSRLRLMLVPDLAARVDDLLVAAPAGDADGSPVRAQRCWLLCRTRGSGAAEDSGDRGEYRAMAR